MRLCFVVNYPKEHIKLPVGNLFQAGDGRRKREYGEVGEREITLSVRYLIKSQCVCVYVCVCTQNGRTLITWQIAPNGIHNLWLQHAALN